MPMENVKKFMELVKAEESLAKRMVALKDGLQEGEFAFKNDKEFVEKKILPLAKEYGIEFSVEDFVEFTNSQLTSLSEEELSEVSGGFPGLSLIMCLSLFIGGAVTPKFASKAVSYFTGGGTSTVQSATDNSVTGETEQTAESPEQREIEKNFSRFVKEKTKKLKKTLNDGTYLSPVARKNKINEIAKSLSGTTGDGQTITAVYNEKNDDITFESDKTSHKERLFETIRTPLYTAQSTNLQQRYNEAYGGEAAQLMQQLNKLKQQLQEKIKERDGYKADHDKLEQDYPNRQGTEAHCYNQLIVLCEYLSHSSYYNTLYKTWKTKLGLRTFSDWDSLKEKGKGYTIPDGSNSYTGDIYVNMLLKIQAVNQEISQLEKSAQQAQNDINLIDTQMKKISNKLQPYAPKQQDFIANMKTEFDYFYGELVKALKEDEKIKTLASSANTTEAKTALAEVIKAKANQLVEDQFSKQLLDGCSLVVDQNGDSIETKIVYGMYWFQQSDFYVDEFISTDNHLAIIKSEASKKRDEVAKKLAEYIQRTRTPIDDDVELKRSIESVLYKLKNKDLLTIKENGKDTTVDLGIEIADVGKKQVTFFSASGGETRETTLTIERIADEYNKMVNMQAMEATRQQKEGTIAYTPFDRTLFNSIGSQARHVLDTLDKIKDLSEVKDREAFENDLNYVAENILKKGDIPYGLRGNYHTDKSIKANDLKRIKEFADKTKKLQ